MSDIDQLKSLIGAELEALVSEIKELKERVASLEKQVVYIDTKNMNSFTKHEYIGHWNHKKIEEKTKVTCNNQTII